MKNEKTIASFDDCGLRPALLDALKKMFPGPTPIQHRVIPIANEGKDVVGIAQTGTGKTLAFGAPMMQILAEKGGQGLVLVPTRELAIQVEEMLIKVGRSFGLRLSLIIGGASMNLQIKSLQRNPHIIVATPGRLNDLMKQKKIDLKNIKIVVLDEADRMLDIGFMPQIKEILSHAPSERQTMLFSATMPAGIAEIAKQFMKQPLRIEVAPPGTAAEKVEQTVYFVESEKKKALLKKLLEENKGTVLIFTRTKFGAKKLTMDLLKLSHSAVEIHSDRTLAQRKDALSGFKNGKYRVLVATDVAARGIDVKDISLVINFDVPDNLDDYVHRIGRTGRAGEKGLAITFARPDQKRDISDIEKLVRKQIPIVSMPEDLCPDDFSKFYLRNEKPSGRAGFAGRRNGFQRRSKFPKAQGRMEQKRKPKEKSYFAW
ncbi:MAG: DEAD/DEAH box helicase [Patescibacteria group bacterium]